MGNVTVGRYSDPELQKDWQGWIEPDDKSWIMFIAGDGKPVVFMNRDESGAVL